MNHTSVKVLPYLFMLMDKWMVLPIVFGRRIDLLKYLDNNLDFNGLITKIPYDPYMWGKDEWAKPPGVYLVGLSFKGDPEPRWFGFASSEGMRKFIDDKTHTLRSGDAEEVIIRYVNLKQL